MPDKMHDSGERAVSRAATSGAEAPPAQPVSGFRHCKPYPAYKDSGVEWLGEVPAHWEVRRLKRLINISSGFAPPLSFDKYEGKYPVYGSNGIIGHCDRYLIAHRAIVIGRVGASGTVHVVPERSWVSDNALIVRIVCPTQLLWLRYILQAANLGEHAAKNAQPIITATFVGNQSLAVPPLPEQTAIAAFLDRETAKIDALVAKKERLIELLREKRAALISHAVTKGLDPDAPLKDSGVEWLGEAPAHWEVKRLKHCTLLCVDKIDFKPVDQTYIGLENIESWTGRLFLQDQPENVDSSVGQFEAGDVLFGKLRPYLAKAARPDFSGVSTGELVVLRPIGYSQDYLFYFLLNKSYIRWVDTLAYGTKMPRVSPSQVWNSMVPCPPLPEQTAIAAFLDRETAKIDALVAKIKEAIARLKEYRVALVSAAVTGKIDVRAAA